MSSTNTSTPESPHLARLFATVRGLEPRTVAVVQPCDGLALESALVAAREGLVRPILVGDRARIVAAARAGDLNIEGLRIVDAPADAEAARAAVELARSGEAEIVMKGSIHSDDFLRPVVSREGGLRTGRRMSHVFVCYYPERVYPKPLLITDAAFNIAPDLAAKRDILENAIDLAHALGIAVPKVAVLAAVETLNPAMPATVDAIALRDLNRSGAIVGAIVDGPLAFDNAVSLEAARMKGMDSPVAGDPDVLLVPDIEAGNMLYKQGVYFCGAITPGIVLGAAVPVLLTSRADPLRARVASCAVAALYVSRRKAAAP